MTQTTYYYGTGKRKCAIAQVRLYPEGGGIIVVNGKPLEEAFPWEAWRVHILKPFKITDQGNRYRVVAKVQGGGVNGQAEALRHGIARALLAADPDLKKALRQHGLLTRDARVKESKKYGLKRARRAPQYTKR